MDDDGIVDMRMSMRCCTPSTLQSNREGEDAKDAASRLKAGTTSD
jgi:hypothetical protein